MKYKKIITYNYYTKLDFYIINFLSRNRVTRELFNILEINLIEYMIFSNL